MDLEARLLALALAEGRITPAESTEAPALDSEAPSAVWGPRISALVAADRLDAGWVERQARALLSPMEGVEDPGWEIQTTPGLPSSWARYADLRLVAVGGQGRVYRAKDTLLDREVALKFLRWDSPFQREWLLREGRAQARVAHPGVCQVHEVGEMGGEAFLALAWVEGPALREALPDLEPSARLDLLIEACEAVHAAHLQGLVHLDLKPGNLLLEGQPDGKLRVRVSDFGLAWRAGEAPLGRVGTPPYASPEQLQGGLHQPGPSADIYALGVLFHQVMAGRLPHEGGPGRLRGDAARAFAKATALDPSRRYESAGAMAADLRALREGRPLPGLGNPPWHRARLWAQRHRWGAAALGVGLVCLSLGSAQLLRLRLQAQAQAKLARGFGQDIERVESLLHLSHVAPPHDLRPIFTQVRGKMEGIRSAMGGLGPEAQGAGWYALGRAHQLLGEDKEALKALEAAWALGNRSPECAEALGLARAEAYLDAIRNVGVDLSRAPNHPAAADLRRQFALPAADLLARAAVDKPDVAKVLEAVRADLEGRPEAAERLASEAFDTRSSRPWEVLPWRILTHFWEYRAQTCIGVGDLRGARVPLGRAWDALNRALDAARSDPYLRLTEGWLCFTEAFLLELEGHLPEAEEGLDRALAAFSRARDLQPDLYLAWKYVVDAHRRKVSLRRRHRLSAQACLREAQRALAEADSQHLSDAGYLFVRRRLLREVMLAAWAAGEDVEGPETERYRADLRARLPRGEADFVTGQLDLDCAEELLHRKRDPRAFLDRAREPLRRGWEQAPRAVERLDTWVDWCLADAEARRRAGEAVDLSWSTPLVRVLEARIREDGPSTELNEWLRALRRDQARAARLRVPAGPGP